MEKRERNICYLSLGSNLGDRKENIDTAISLLKENSNIKVSKISSIIETKPWGKIDQPDFLNCVLEIETELDPQKLLKTCFIIETICGRFRNEKWEPRPIDIDILFFGKEVIEVENLIVPHPLLHKREFVLHSLNEICPEMVHPIFNKKIKDIYLEKKVV